MTGRKLRMEDRWKRRKAPQRRIMLVRTAAPAPAPAPAPVVDEARVRLDQGRVDYGSVYRARIKSLGDDGSRKRRVFSCGRSRP